MRKSLSQRRFWKTERSRPRSSARAASSRASAAVPAIGLSTTTGRPALGRRWRAATCVLFGDAMTIRSSSSARAHSSSAEAAMPADGQAGQEWIEVLTAGFEFVRPGADDEDRRPAFQPNSLL